MPFNSDDRDTMPSGDETKIFHVPTADTTIPDLRGTAIHAAPTLTIVKGPSSGDVFELNEMGEVTLGRDPSNDVWLNDMTVSRHHAVIDLSGIASGVVTIKDLGSLNGTWVDGAIINQAYIKDGSTIQIGTFRLIFHANRTYSRIKTGA